MTYPLKSSDTNPLFTAIASPKESIIIQSVIPILAIFKILSFLEYFNKSDICKKMSFFTVCESVEVFVWFDEISRIASVELYKSTLESASNAFADMEHDEMFSTASVLLI